MPIVSPFKDETFTYGDEILNLNEFEGAEELMSWAADNKIKLNFNENKKGVYSLNTDNPIMFVGSGETKRPERMGFLADSALYSDTKEKVINKSYGKFNLENAKDAAISVGGPVGLEIAMDKYLTEDYSGPVGQTGFMSPEAPQEAPQEAVLENLAKPYLNVGYQGPIALDQLANAPFFGPGTVDYKSARSIPIPTIGLPGV